MEYKNILAVTACLKRCSIAINYEGILYETNENTDAATNLVYLANKLIKNNQINIQNINSIMTSSGPGSFTGIRTAQSFAKALSLALRIPAISIDYFDIIDNILMKDSQSHSKKLIAIKSEKNQVYFKKIPFKKQTDIGISTYEKVVNMLDFDEMIIGDAVYEIIEHIKNNKKNPYKYISEFKAAKHLLGLSNHLTENSNVYPLYINASS